MNYFAIYKTDKNVVCEAPIEFIGGYSFAKKTKITLYNSGMMNYILTKKLNTSLKNIINLYLLCANNDDEEADSDDARAALIPRIELMRNVLLEQYSFYLDKAVIEDYLNKLDKMEIKVGNLEPKKSRRM